MAYDEPVLRCSGQNRRLDIPSKGKGHITCLFPVFVFLVRAEFIDFAIASTEGWRKEDADLGARVTYAL